MSAVPLPRVLIAVASTTALACGGNGAGPTGGGGAGPPASLSVLSGENQSGKTGEEAPEALVVLVQDAQGRAVAGVTVRWAVVSGGGTLSDATTQTLASGQSGVSFTSPPELGVSVVEASVSGLGAPARFTIDTDVFLIEIVNHEYIGPGGTVDAATVPFRTTVEWVNRDDPDQTGAHTVTSTALPAFGRAFDSGALGLGDRFAFKAEAMGTWEYICSVHGAAQGSATLTGQ